MTCCNHYSVAEKQFDGKKADSDLQRYRRRGPDAVTRLMLAELRRWPLQGEDLLDVGSGIGVIGAELADSRLASATLVDASPAYLDVARAEIESRYESRPTRFLLGDFATIADTVTAADVVTLNRVVCCYPDAEALLRGAASRTRRLLAFSYPRDRWYMWVMTALENLWRRLRGSSFRTFVHQPERMAAVLEAAGLVRVARQGTLVWVLDVYRRRETV